MNGSIYILYIFVNTIICVSLPDVELLRGLLHPLDPSREGQEGLALDLARHHRHFGLLRVDVLSDVMGHHLRPAPVVRAVGQQGEQYLEETLTAEESVKRVHGGPKHGSYLLRYGGPINNPPPWIRCLCYKVILNLQEFTDLN